MILLNSFREGEKSKGGSSFLINLVPLGLFLAEVSLRLLNLLFVILWLYLVTSYFLGSESYPKETIDGFDKNKWELSFLAKGYGGIYTDAKASIESLWLGWFNVLKGLDLSIVVDILVSLFLVFTFFLSLMWDLPKAELFMDDLMIESLNFYD